MRIIISRAHFPLNKDLHHHKLCSLFLEQECSYQTFNTSPSPFHPHTCTIHSTTSYRFIPSLPYPQSHNPIQLSLRFAPYLRRTSSTPKRHRHSYRIPDAYIKIQTCTSFLHTPTSTPFRLLKHAVTNTRNFYIYNFRG